MWESTGQQHISGIDTDLFCEAVVWVNVVLTSEIFHPLVL